MSMKHRPDLYILVDGRKILRCDRGRYEPYPQERNQRQLLPQTFPPTSFQSYILLTFPSRNLQTPKPLPQLPCARRSPPHMPLPIRIILPITQRPSLCRRRYHFDAILAIVVSFGNIAGVGFVFFEGLFEGVRGLAFSF